MSNLKGFSESVETVADRGYDLYDACAHSPFNMNNKKKAASLHPETASCKYSVYLITLLQNYHFPTAWDPLTVQVLPS